MDATSNVSDLTARLQQRTEQDRQHIEALVQRQLTELSENLHRIAKRELSTIERNTRSWGTRLSWAVLTAWSRPVAVGLLILLGICGGNWGLTRWLPSGIQTRIETRTALTRQIAQYQEQRDRLRAETWGVLFHEDAGGRFLVLPEGTVLDTLPYTLGDRRAVKLLSE